MTRKIVSCALCVCLAAAMLAGCGKKPAETTAPAESTYPLSTAAPETTAPEATVPETTVPETTAPATTAPRETNPVLFSHPDFPLQMTYASGAGGWRTELTLNADGTFSGSYTDSELGETGVDYPNGTLYYCNFSGCFDVISENDDHTYALELSVFSADAKAGESEIRDGIRYLSADAPGLSGLSFVLGAPEASASMLGEFPVFSWPGNLQNPVPETLSCWALYNVSEDCAFFTYE